jgi:hypothetical protein
MAKVLCCILAVLLFTVISISSGQAHQQASANADAKSGESIVACTDNSKKASELPPPGPECAKEEFAKRGQPFMFPAHRGVAYGISSGPGKPSTLYLWADNRTEKDADLLICCVSTLFEQIDIYDSAGVRLLSKADQAARKAGLEGRVVVGGGCTCSGWVLVPPHTIKFLEFADISDGYVLPSGRYIIAERPPVSGSNPKLEAQTGASSTPPGLDISIP